MRMEPDSSRWFEKIFKEGENKWNLPEEMARYANKLFEEYIPYGNIEEKLLAKTHVPSNLDKVKLEQTHAWLMIQSQQIPEKNFSCHNSTFGTLDEFSHNLRRDSRGTSGWFFPFSRKKRYVVRISIQCNIMSKWIQYFIQSKKRREESKVSLQDKTALLQKHDGNLFRKTFRAHIIETEKSKKKTMKGFKTTASSSASRKPFSKGLLSVSLTKNITAGVDSSTQEKEIE